LVNQPSDFLLDILDLLYWQQSCSLFVVGFHLDETLHGVCVGIVANDDVVVSAE